jgi:ubiquinone/menaquinone biosynthesis C-methylase UbiE
MTDTETFQLSLAAAESYEAKFVPALFGEWAPLVVDAGKLHAGDVVLDVACGTGVAAREAARRVGETGRVVGLDINEAMLAVAARIQPDIEWRQSDASSLPFPDGTFDAVLCQAALMFFPDRHGALSEMRRVVKSSGTVAVQVWASLDAQPAYGPFVDVAARHAGPDAIELLSSYWTLGDLDATARLFSDAGLAIAKTRTHTGTARFASIEEFVKIEIESTPLIDRVDEATYSAIRADARSVLAPFETSDRNVEIPIVGHVLTAAP